MADLSIDKDPHFQVRGIPDEVKMNQLQSLIHDALIGTGHVSQCAILKRKDGLIRASSVGFQLSNEQTQMIINAFKNPAATREEGLYYDDNQYKCVRSDKNSIYSKCGSKGLILVRTHTLVIAATYTTSMYPSVCVEAVERLADYFKEKGK
ncbi:profilin-4-like isoform X1 [Watersipora subatra]|uniref:profilin-4-like isoform X1 n=2 Tax=Watersipora subatra TaxID=2589382 RepID=UPI00355BE7FB